MNWIGEQCDYDWFYCNPMEVKNTKNPGWSVVIDLQDTNLEELELISPLFEVDDDNWYYYQIKDKKYEAAGDVNKLDIILEEFKNIAIKHGKKKGIPPRE